MIFVLIREQTRAWEINNEDDMSDFEMHILLSNYLIFVQINSCSSFYMKAACLIGHLRFEIWKERD